MPDIRHLARSLVTLAFMASGCTFTGDLGNYPDGADGGAPASGSEAVEAGGGERGGGAGEGGADAAPGPDGQCGGLTAPVVLASDQHNLNHLVIDAENVYWTSAGTTNANGWNADGAVMKAPKAGGSSVPLASRETYPDALAVDDEHVYWTHSAENSVRRVSKNGAGAAAVDFWKPAESTTGVAYLQLDHLAVFGGDLYGIGMLSRSQGKFDVTVTKTSLSQGSTTKLTSDPFTSTNGASFSFRIVADGTGVTWAYYLNLTTASDGGSTTFATVPNGTFAPRVIATTGTLGAEFALDGSGLYAPELDSAGGQQGVAKLDEATGTQTELVKASARNFAMDSANLYWFESTCASSGPEGCTAHAATLYRAPKTGGPRVALLTVPTSVSVVDIAVDGSCVYWADFSSGTIAKFAK